MSFVHSSLQEVFLEGSMARSTLHLHLFLILKCGIRRFIFCMPWWHSPVHPAQTLCSLLKTLQSRILWHGPLIIPSTLRNADRIIVLTTEGTWTRAQPSAVQDECGQQGMLRKEPDPEQCMHTHSCPHTTRALVLWLLGTTSWTVYILKRRFSYLSRAKLHRSKMTT